jgi:hypothetical protein
MINMPIKVIRRIIAAQSHIVTQLKGVYHELDHREC